MRVLAALIIVTGQSAAAHPSHLAGLAGHDHWVAGAAIGLAVLAGLYGLLKGDKDVPVEEEIEEEAA